MKFGIMGPGRISRKFADAVLRTEGAKLVGVASKSTERAKKFAEEFAIKNFYGSYEDLAKSDVDVIYIGTTNNAHYENMIVSIENGKHVLCEKPFTLSYEQTKDIFERARQHGVFVMEAMWSIFLPSTIKAKEIAQSGKIGDIKQIDSCINYNNLGGDSDRMFNKELGGGVLYDLGVYNLWMSCFFAESYPDIVKGVAELNSNGIDITDVLAARFSNGITASMRCGGTYFGNGKLTIYGTKGCVIMNRPFQDSHLIRVEVGDIVEEYRFEHPNGFVYELNEVIKCIKDGKKQSDIASWERSLKIAEITTNLLNDWASESNS